MATAELDTRHLSAFCSLPQTTIHTILEAPTPELIQDLLRNISTRAHEYDALKSDKLRLDVELENAVRGGDAKARALKASSDKRSKEAADLRTQLETESKYTAGGVGILLINSL